LLCRNLNYQWLREQYGEYDFGRTDAGGVSGEEGVDCMFGYPGGVTFRFTSAYEPPDPPRAGAARQNAAFARRLGASTGQGGRVLRASGPGATNLVTGLVNR